MVNPVRAKRNRAILACVLVAALSVTALAVPSRAAVPAQPVPDGQALLERVLRLIRSDYVEETDAGATAQGAFRGLINSLDPLSGYLPPELAARYTAPAGKEMDPGLVLLKRAGSFPVVVAVIPASPAEKAGIVAGDQVAAVEGRGTMPMSLVELNLLLRDTRPAPVRLRIVHGTETKEVQAARAVRPGLPATYTPPAGGAPAVLAVRSLSGPVAEEIASKWGSALRGLKGSLVLDLRDCGDGTPAEAARLVNLFLKAGEIGAFEVKDGRREPLAAPAEAAVPRLPLVVWVDAGTIGPAEIAAGVLQEMRGAKVVGVATPGMAGETRYFPLQDGSGIILTSGVFSLPSGKKIWETGVSPDSALAADATSLKGYLEKTASLAGGATK